MATLSHHDKAGYEMVISNLHKQIREYDILKTRIAKLETRLSKIDEYDRHVKATVASDPRLQEAWDNFAVSYQMIASDELLTRARDKIWKAEGTTQDICPQCKMIKQRQMGDLRIWDSYSRDGFGVSHI